MNTHDIELPPLLPSVKDCEVTYENYSSVEMVEYARAAIAPYAKRIAELEADIPQDRGYSPRKIGAELFRGGYGISEIWGAVKSDSDMNEALLGYMEAKKTQDREVIAERDAEIRSLKHELAELQFKLQGMDMREQAPIARRVKGEAK